MGDYHLKDPGAALDYRIDWGGVLADGMTLVSSAWSVEPDEAGGLAADGGALTGAAAVTRLSGGVAGHVYRLCNRVTFSDGSADERTLVVRVEER